jgi:hypothetical protein
MTTAPKYLHPRRSAPLKYLGALLLAFLIFSTACRAQEKTWRVIPTDPLVKLASLDPDHLGALPARPVQMRAARGEWECFQFVVRSAAPIASLELSSTHLSTPTASIIEKSNLQLFQQHFIEVKKPSGNRDLEPKWWPDALIPLGSAPQKPLPGQSDRAFWGAVYVPPDARPGEYFGAIDVVADGQTRSLALSLIVEPVSLGAPTMRANVALYYDVLRDWYGKNVRAYSDEEWAAQKKKFYDFLLSYRLNAYDLPVAWDDPQAPKYLGDARVHSVRLPPLGDSDFPRALQVLRATRTLGKSYYYRIDEPTPEAYPQVLEATKQLRETDPKLKHLVTAHPNNALQGVVDIWCPNIGDATGLGWLDSNVLASERKKGRETWWYTMVEPKFPYPTWLLDDDALAVRSYGWLMARWNISGFVYSMAHGWGPKPFESLESFADTNGDGTLLYPGEVVGAQGPTPSIRLMLLRDAIEDYELSRQEPEALNLLLRDDVTDGQSSLTAGIPVGQMRDAIFSWKTKALLQLSTSGLVEGPPLNLQVIQALSPRLDGVINDAAWKAQTRIATSNGRFVRAGSEGAMWPQTALYLSRDSQYLYAAIRARSGPQVLADSYFALEIAPPDGHEKWRLVITPKNNLVVERYTREGRFRVENAGWKAAQKKFSGYTDVEMAIPLSLLRGKQWRINALRRVVHTSQAKVTLSAFDDVGDARQMPLFAVR